MNPWVKWLAAAAPLLLIFVLGVDTAANIGALTAWRLDAGAAVDAPVVLSFGARRRTSASGMMIETSLGVRRDRRYDLKTPCGDFWGNGSRGLSSIGFDPPYGGDAGCRARMAPLLEALSHARSYRSLNDRLTLTLDDGRVLVFRR